MSSGSATTTFLKSGKSESDDGSVYLRYAHGIVSEYLMEDLSLKLLKYLNLPEDVQANLKRKNQTLQLSDMKKAKGEDECKSNTQGNVLDLSKPDVKGASKQVVLGSSDKGKHKTGGGGKSLSSFFKKT